MSQDYNPTVEVETLEATEEILREHVGESNAITSGAIAQELDAVESHDTNPNVRDAVRELIRFRQLPVASGHNGYYITENRGEVDSYVDDLRSRADSIQERADLMEQAARAEGLEKPGLWARISTVFGGN